MSVRVCFTIKQRVTIRFKKAVLMHEEPCSISFQREGAAMDVYGCATDPPAAG